MILDTIAESTKIRVEAIKKQKPLDQIREEALFMPKGDFSFEKALTKDDISFICEVKKASPSKGLIAEDFDYLQIAKDYVKAGADAISVLTEPEYFKGDDRYLSEIAQTVSIPVLRKDFTVDAYQIYEAKTIGASAILLICAILSEEQIKEYLMICEELGLAALVEAHTKEEVDMALRCGARLIGVNNRDLQTFEVDIRTCIDLRESVPSDLIFVAESGIKTSQDIEMLRNANVDAVLIGETLMRSTDKSKTLNGLKGN